MIEKPSRDSNNSLTDKLQKKISYSFPPSNSKLANYFLFVFAFLNFFEKVYSLELQPGKILNKCILILFYSKLIIISENSTIYLSIFRLV